MRSPGSLRRSALALVTFVAISAVALVAPRGQAAHAAIPADTVLGEGGGAMVPVMDKLLQNDGANLTPEFGSYTDVNNDVAIADFVGSAPNTFNADFAVTERPLTAAEVAKAKANGRSFAYVPFAASPLAIVTLVPDSSYQGTTTINANQYCEHIPLTLTEVAQIFGFDASDPLQSWGDPRIQCSTPGTTADATPISLWANDDPTMENSVLMSFLDSTTASKALFQAGLDNAQKGANALTTDVTPSELWPYAKPSIPGGDQNLIGKVIAINPQTNAPSTEASLLTLGAALPVASVWTGDPLSGVVWNLPTAAIQNAQGAFVAPSAASAAATEGEATLAATADPTTNNLVTFNASASDATAYNASLMLQSYLVVPLNGLPAAKATALAQFIRYAVGGKGQADIASLGGAPATKAMASADLAVAQQLDQEAASAPTTTTTTTTTAGGSSGGSSTSGGGASSSGDASATSGSNLAFTGANPFPIFVSGLALLAAGEMSRRLIKRRAARR